MSLTTTYPKVPLFENVAIDLDPFLTPDSFKYYVDGDVIFEAGDPANHLLIILRGQVKIYSGDSFVVERGSLSVLGEQALIDEAPRSATAIAQGMVQVLCLPRYVVEILLTDLQFTKNLLRVLSTKLREATDERGFRYGNEQLLFHEFKAHVSPEIANRLLTMGINYGEPRYCDSIVLFSDIRSFTTKSAGISPERLGDDLSIYLDAMVKIIHAHEGLVDKFVGDAVMAIWGYAPSTENLAEQALRCANEMINTAKQLKFAGMPINIGVGIGFGQVFMGNVGSSGKRQFTVLGTPVNLAARCEALTKELLSSVVVSETFFEQLLPGTQSQFLIHEKDVKGLGVQTVYSLQELNHELES